VTPPLPSLRALTNELRELHQAWSHPDAGGEYAALTRVYDPEILGHRWQVRAAGDDNAQFGHEYIPGDGARFNATAAARRLLAAARDAQASDPPILGSDLKGIRFC
jgi:hypothetical protein